MNQIIIEANWKEVRDAVRNVGFSVEQTMVKGDWIAALLRR